MTERPSGRVPRTRSVYRLSGVARAVAGDDAPSITPGVRQVAAADRDAVAEVLLDAYRGTIDDEGEDADDARAAIDHYFAHIEWPHSVVLDLGGRVVAMSFVVKVGDVFYIDPVATISSLKRTGHGRAVVLAALRSLAADGVDEVGAVITDGNTASERLFASLGFSRIGTWG